MCKSTNSTPSAVDVRVRLLDALTKPLSALAKPQPIDTKLELLLPPYCQQASPELSSDCTGKEGIDHATIWYFDVATFRCMAKMAPARCLRGLAYRNNAFTSRGVCDSMCIDAMVRIVTVLLSNQGSFEVIPLSEYSGAYCNAGIGARVAMLDADSLERTDKRCTHTYNLRGNNMRNVNNTKVICEKGGECLSGTCCNSTWIGNENLLIRGRFLFRCCV